MPNHASDVASLETPRDRWDLVLEWQLIGLLGFMPLALGAVEAWSEMVVSLVAACMCVCLTLKFVSNPRSRIFWTWTYVPVALFLLLTAFQLIPLSTEVATQISPQTVTAKTSLLSDLAEAPGYDLRQSTLSFYPCATKRHLRLMLVAAIVFVVVVNVYRRPSQIKRLLTAIAAIGGAFAVLALLQVATGTSMIYWAVEDGHDGVATAGSFVNHSHYAQFMNLSLGAALALLLVRLEEAVRHHRSAFSSIGGIMHELRSQSLGWLVGVIILGGVSVLTSLSRNGVLSLLAASVLTGIALASSKNLRWRGWLFATVFLIGFAALLFVGVDAVYDRLATLQDAHEDSRWQMALGAVEAWRDYPVFGTGLGTHEVVFPMYDPLIAGSIAAHADCDYAQMLEEAGTLGVGLVTAFLAGIWWCYWRLIRYGKTPLALAAFGLGFGLIAIMIHSTSDFGQHLPANFCLTAVSCGLLVVINRLERRLDGEDAETEPQLTERRTDRWIAALAIPGVLAVGAWTVFGANDARIAEGYFARALGIEGELREIDWLGDDQQYTELLEHAEAAVQSQPDNVKYRYWLNLYRWYSVSRSVDPENGQVALHPDVIPHVARIADEFAQARVICPTFGPVYSVEGQIRLFVLEQPAGGDLIDKGYRLAPYDPPTCFIAGVRSVQQGDLEETASRFQRAVEIDGSFYNEVLAIYVHELNRPDLARRLAGEDYRRLLKLANSLSVLDEHANLEEAVRGDALAILVQRCQSPEATSGELATLAGIYYRAENHAAAVDHYRRALNLDYDQVGWRLSLARSLAETGRTEEAIHQARICLRLQPELKSAKQLIAELSVAPSE